MTRNKVKKAVCSPRHKVWKYVLVSAYQGHSLGLVSELKSTSQSCPGEMQQGYSCLGEMRQGLGLGLIF